MVPGFQSPEILYSRTSVYGMLPMPEVPSNGTSGMQIANLTKWQHANSSAGTLASDSSSLADPAVVLVVLYLN
jgi:hypothetical protein